MKQIVNKIIPPKGFKAITLWPFIFTHSLLSGEDLNHENIHGEQQKEMLFVGVLIALALVVLGCGWWSLLALPIFFYWYVIEWLIRLCLGGDAYKNISFEQEAYIHEGNLSYIGTRNPFAWFKYLTTRYK